MTHDPKNTHDLDQALASFRLMAGMTGQYYKELTAQGVDPNVAMILTIEAQKAMISAIWTHVPKPS